MYSDEREYYAASLGIETPKVNVLSLRGEDDKEEAAAATKNIGNFYFHRV